MERNEEDRIYLGFDFSTQQVRTRHSNFTLLTYKSYFQIKGIAIDESLKVLAEDHVTFDLDLKEYRTQHGFHQGHDGRVTSPTIMWVKALDILMERLRIQGIDMSRVSALSGAGKDES